MEAMKGSGNVNFSSFPKAAESKQDNVLRAKSGPPQPEMSEFKGMSIKEKIQVLYNSVSSLNNKLDLESLKTGNDEIKGNLLRHDLNQLMQLNRLGLAKDKDLANLLQGKETGIIDRLAGAQARKDNPKWGSNDDRVTIDINKTEESIKLDEKNWSNITLSNTAKKEMTIAKTSHEILNKLYEKW